MPEAYNLAYYTISIIGLAVRQIIAAAVLVVLCRNFMECGHVENRKCAAGSHAFSRTALIGCAYFLVYMGLYYTIPGMGNWSTNIPALLTSFFVCVWMERKRIRTKLFLFCTFGVIHWIALSIANSVSHFLALQIDKIIIYTAGYENPSLHTYYFMSFLAYFLMHMILYGVILYGMVRKISRLFADKQQDIGHGELALLLLPSVNGIVIHGLFHVYAPIYENEMEGSIFQNHFALELLWLLCYVVILAVMLGTISLYQNIRKKQGEERARLMLESQVRDIQSHITEVERIYTDIRGVKHDIKNHIEVINSLLAQGKTTEVRTYSTSLSKAVEAFDFSVRTGNPVTDVILHEKMSKAAELGISFTSDFHYPADMGIDAFDISVILSNALTNAIEAGKEGGFIKVSSFRNKNAYLIKVENSFEGSLDFDEESGLPNTKKSNQKTHGFGLQNIKSVAARYYGGVLIEQGEDTVTLTVLLLSARSAHNKK